jgi:hypothetical protein
MNCSLQAVTNRSVEAGLENEDGPRVGVGLFQDLVDVSRARHGVIMSKSSTSSWPMATLVEYDRIVEHVMTGQPLTLLPKLHTCVI